MRPIDQLRNPLNDVSEGRWVALLSSAPNLRRPFPGSRWIRPRLPFLRRRLP